MQDNQSPTNTRQIPDKDVSLYTTMFRYSLILVNFPETKVNNGLYYCKGDTRFQGTKIPITFFYTATYTHCLFCSDKYPTDLHKQNPSYGKEGLHKNTKIRY